MTTEEAKTVATNNTDFKIILRDISPRMVQAWKECSFGTDSKYKDILQISQGDIFKGCPAADAIVSPANSFGFMDGGIDAAYSFHFGWQMMERLQEVIKEEYDGEILVGDAAIIPAYPLDTDYNKLQLYPTHNEGKPIKYLISAPTMRVPEDVSDTTNSYLAFRAVLRAVIRHNSKCKETGQDPIRSVLCPGLGTCVGRMPFKRCAVQMVTAYEAIVLKTFNEFINPSSLAYSTREHERLLKIGDNTDIQTSKKKGVGEIFVEK